MLGFYGNDCVSDYVRKKGTWEHLACVYDKASQTQTIVVDGVVVKSCTGKSPFLGEDMVNLGDWENSQKLWKGKIKIVKIFNRALTAEQIDDMLQGNKLAFLV